MDLVATSIQGANPDTVEMVVPEDDPIFKVNLTFNRAFPAVGSGVNASFPRTPYNGQTAWLDLSFVYPMDNVRSHVPPIWVLLL